MEAKDVGNYRELVVWQKGIHLAKQVYKLTESFPSREMYGLTNQIRRAVVSIPSNIAEGKARQGDVEFQRFLHIALGSLAELDTQLVLACELNYMAANDEEPLEGQIREIRKMLHALIRGMKARNDRNH
jgi:four helix bundle protein